MASITTTEIATLTNEFGIHTADEAGKLVVFTRPGEGTRELHAALVNFVKTAKPADLEIIDLGAKSLGGKVTEVRTALHDLEAVVYDIDIVQD